MKITKYGHCCLLIETDGKRILTDPGKWSQGFEDLQDIDLVLITHEHADHFHTESVQTIAARNPQAEIVANRAVGKLMAELGLTPTILEGRDAATIRGVAIEAFDGPHAEIFEAFGLVQNTGYLIAGRLFYPGDAYTEPGKEIEILALPVAGPWCKTADALRYAIAVQPRKAVPVHDATLSPAGLDLTHGLFKAQLEQHGIEFMKLEAGQSGEY